MGATNQTGRTYNQKHVLAAVHAGATTFQHLLDVELSVGSEPGPDQPGQSFLDHDRGSPGRLAEF